MSVKDCLTGKGNIKEQIKFKNRIYMFLIILCVLYYGGIFTGIIDFNKSSVNAVSIYNGIAGGYMIVSIVSIVRNKRMLKNEDMLRKYQIEVRDERNISIARKSLSISVFIYLWLCFIGGVAALNYNEAVANTLFYSVCGLLIVYCIVNFIMKKIL
ncbi:MAG: hypothetical protein Q4F63_01940 [Clostridia bacterium]|nr:hypothetical protein [Clostridia bacterium]